MSVLANKRRNKTVRREIVRLTNTYFQQKYLELVLEDIYKAQRSGGFLAIVDGVIPSPDSTNGSFNSNNVV